MYRQNGAKGANGASALSTALLLKDIKSAYSQKPNM